MDARRADGIVLVVTLLVILLMSALAAALVAVTASEAMIAANFRDSQAARHAADAAAERALGDLSSVTDWNQVLNGAVQSTFVDGPPYGTRARGGATLDLTEIVHLANCRQPTPCSSAEMDRATVERPWGANNPRWQLYAYGKLEDVLPAATAASSYYAIVLVGDDPSENDGNPLRDAPPTAPGAGMLALRAEVFGPRNAHRVVELTIGRTGYGVRMVSWREHQ